MCVSVRCVGVWECGGMIDPGSHPSTHPPIIYTYNNNNPLARKLSKYLHEALDLGGAAPLLVALQVLRWLFWLI